MKVSSMELTQIEDIIDLLDCKTRNEVSRIKINSSEDFDLGHVNEEYHHGRCDVGSPWATGTIKNL